MEFVTLYHPHKVREDISWRGTLRSVPGGYVLTAGASGKKLTALLPTDDTKTLEAEGMTTTGAIKVKLERPDQGAQTIEIRQGDLH